MKKFKLEIHCVFSLPANRINDYSDGDTPFFFSCPLPSALKNMMWCFLKKSLMTKFYFYSKGPTT